VGKPSIFPQEFHFQNYIDIWKKIQLGRYTLNGLFYSFTSTLIILLISVPASYALSRFRFRGKRVFMMIVIITQMFSVATIIVPIFLFIIKLNLFNTYTGVIFIISAISTPLGIWYLLAFFDKVPKELEEAGMIDGCTRIQAVIRLVLPVAAPGLVTSAIVIFTMSYKQFFIPLVLLSSAEKYPALVGVYTLANELAPPWHLVMAAVFITILPPLILFLFTNKYVVSGIGSGAVKG
jgi:multiple sugar transport system permease protein